MLIVMFIYCSNLKLRKRLKKKIIGINFEDEKSFSLTKSIINIVMNLNLICFQKQNSFSQ